MSEGGKTFDVPGGARVCTPTSDPIGKAPRKRRARRVPKADFLTRVLALSGWMLAAWAIKRRLRAAAGKRPIPAFGYIARNTVIGYLPRMMAEAQGEGGLPGEETARALLTGPGGSVKVGSEGGDGHAGHYF